MRPEFMRDDPEPTFREWAEEQLSVALEYRHRPRIERFEQILGLHAGGRLELALWFVPPSDEARAKHLTR
jgi:hypothetical protein